MDKEDRLRLKRKPRTVRRNFQLETAFRCRNAGPARNPDGSPTLAYAEWLEGKIEEARQIALDHFNGVHCPESAMHRWLRET